MARPKKTETQLQTTRSHVLDSAYIILQESGPQALTVRAIASRLGVAPMSLYTYFDSQAAILAALNKREVAKMRTQQQIYERRAETEDIAQVVQEDLKYFILYARDNPNIYRLAWITPEAGGENPQQNRQRMQDTVEHLVRLLKMGMERGVFVRREPFLAAVTVLGMVNMPYTLYYTGKLIDSDLLERIVEETLFAAILYLQKDAAAM